MAQAVLWTFLPAQPDQVEDHVWEYDHIHKFPYLQMPPACIGLPACACVSEVVWCAGLASLTAGGPGNWAPPSPAPPTGPKVNPFLRGTDSNATAGSSSGPTGGNSMPSALPPGPSNQVKVRCLYSMCASSTQSFL